MNTYVSLLRGINVGKQKKIAMNDLVSLYKDIGFLNIKTYFNSGNVIFKSGAQDNNSLADIIEKKIKERFNFDVPVIIRTSGAMQEIAGNNPFIKNGEIETDKLYTTFLYEKPADVQVGEISKISSETDKFILIAREAYLYIPGFYSETKFTNDFFEKRLKVRLTTRNWKTVVALVDLTKSKSS